MGGKGGGSSQQQATTSSTAPPAYIQAAYTDILNKAGQTNQLPLTQYGGAQLAGFTPLQNQGFTDVQNAASSGMPYYDAANNMVTGGTGDIWSQTPEFNSANISQFMNPYQQNVIDSTMSNIRRNNALQQQDLTGSAIKAGAWGGSGAEDAKNNLARTQADSANTTIAGLQGAGYDNAVNNFNANRTAQLTALSNQNQNKLTGAGILGSLGNASVNNGIAGANAELAAGSTQQQLAQNALNIPYQQFLEQQGYPYTNLQYYANIASALGSGSGGTTTGTATVPGQQSNTFGNILGLGLTAASVFSDERVKENIKQVGKLDNGLPVYQYNYKGSPKTQIGLIAQDVEEKHPGAVGEVDGIKTVDYARATRADGGRLSYAAGGGIMGGGYIPTTGIQNATLNAPAPMPIPEAPQQQDNSLESIMAAMNGMKGFDKETGFGGLGLDNWLGKGTLSTGAQNLAGFGGSLSGGAKNLAGMGGMLHFADGGAITAGTNLPGGATFAGNSDVVAGTPTYSFNPLVAKSKGVTVPTAFNDGSGANTATYNPTPAATTSAGPGSTGINNFDDFKKEIVRNTALQNSFLPIMGGAVSPDQWQYRANALYDIYNIQPEQYSQYLFANGGIVGNRQKLAGGGVATGMPYDLSATQMMPAQMTQQMPTIPGSALPQVPDAGRGYVPTPNLGAGALTAPRSAAMPSPQQIVQQQIMRANQGLAQAQSQPQPSVSTAPLSPQAGAIDATAAAPDENIIDRAMNTPWRAGLLNAGLGMIGQSSRKDIGTIIGEGLGNGLAGYAGAKKSKQDAADRANKLLMEAQKYKDDRDDKQQDLEIRKAELGIKRQEADQKANAFDLDKMGEQVLYKAASGQPLTPQEQAIGRAYDAKKAQVYTDVTGNVVRKPDAFGSLNGGGGQGGGMGGESMIPSGDAIDLGAGQPMPGGSGQVPVPPRPTGIAVTDDGAFNEALAAAGRNKNARQKVIESNAVMPLQMSQKQIESDLSVQKKAKEDFNKADIESQALKSALDEYVKSIGSTDAKERAQTVAGVPTVLGTNYNNAILLAKGETLFNLGVLNGGDLKRLQQSLADPSTISGNMASVDTVKKQAQQIQKLIDGRMELAAKKAGVDYQSSGAADPKAKLPEGAVKIGTSGGKGVYQLPDGSHVMEQ